MLTFRTPEEAVEKANNTAYGLSAGVWTEKGSRILWMADKLKAGVVWANTFNRFDPASPFGGYKESGFGREGGRHGLEPYLQLRGRDDEALPAAAAPARRRGRARARRPPLREPPVSRLPVKKTYKLFIGGAFPRSESGRTYEAEGQNVARASRKDARDAVVAARKAIPGWAGATAYNRGQVLYRLAEMMETRAADLAAVCSGKKEVEAAIDRVVWYAGWADKLAQVIGSSNPVAGPYFNFSIPEPTGVVAVLAPEEPALAGLVSRIAPVIVGGNAAVVVASESHPLAALELAEAIATSDLPGGVVNILTGLQDELAPILAGHMDVNAIDLTGANGTSAEPRAARGRQRQAGRPRHRRRAEPLDDLEVPRAQDRLASCRSIGGYPGKPGHPRRKIPEGGTLRAASDHVRRRPRDLTAAAAAATLRCVTRPWKEAHPDDCVFRPLPRRRLTRPPSSTPL